MKKKNCLQRERPEGQEILGFNCNKESSTRMLSIYTFPGLRTPISTSANRYGEGTDQISPSGLISWCYLGVGATWKCFCVHVVSLHLTLTVLHGKQLTAVLLKVYPPASLGLAVPDYVTFPNLFKGLLDFVTRSLLLSLRWEAWLLKCSTCWY